MSQLDLKIGPKIKSFRRQLGLQANKLAEDLGISPSLTIAFPILGFVLTKSLTSGPKISKS